MNDVSISGQALTLFSGLLVAVVGALSLLFRLLMKTKDDFTKEIADDRDDWRKIALRQQDTITRLTQAANTAVSVAFAAPDGDRT